MIDKDELGFLPYLIHEVLYMDTPITTPSTATSKHPAQPHIESTTAQMGQPILFILVETDYLAPQEQDTLVKIVEAVGLTLAQTQKVVIAKYKPQPILYPHYLISFSLQRPPFIINEKYQVVTREHKKLLWADTLEELVRDKTKKRQLWEKLQEMFALKK